MTFRTTAILPTGLAAAAAAIMALAAPSTGAAQSEQAFLSHFEGRFSGVRHAAARRRGRRTVDQLQRGRDAAFWRRHQHQGKLRGADLPVGRRRDHTLRPGRRRLYRPVAGPKLDLRSLWFALGRHADAEHRAARRSARLGRRRHDDRSGDGARTVQSDGGQRAGRAAAAAGGRGAERGLAGNPWQALPGPFETAALPPQGKDFTPSKRLIPRSAEGASGRIGVRAVAARRELGRVIGPLSRCP